MEVTGTVRRMDEMIAGARVRPATLTMMRAPIPRDRLVAHAWRAEYPEFGRKKYTVITVEVGAGVVVTSKLSVRNGEAAHLCTDVYSLRNASLSLKGEECSVVVVLPDDDEWLQLLLGEQTPDCIAELAAEIARSA